MGTHAQDTRILPHCRARSANPHNILNPHSRSPLSISPRQDHVSRGTLTPKRPPLNQSIQDGKRAMAHLEGFNDHLFRCYKKHCTDNSCQSTGNPQIPGTNSGGLGSPSGQALPAHITNTRQRGVSLRLGISGFGFGAKSWLLRAGTSFCEHWLLRIGSGAVKALSQFGMTSVKPQP